MTAVGRRPQSLESVRDEMGDVGIVVADMETLALVNDPVDQERVAEAEWSVGEGDVISGEDMSRLVAERVQRPTGAA